MPGRPSKPCNYPGCGKLVRDGSSRCEVHRSAGKWGDPARGSRHQRGYGSAWTKLRLQILERDRWLCMCPRCMGGDLRVRAASEVDHIKPKAEGGTDDPHNLRSVHPECHKQLTAEAKR